MSNLPEWWEDLGRTRKARPCYFRKGWNWASEGNSIQNPELKVDAIQTTGSRLKWVDRGTSQKRIPVTHRL